MITKKIVTGISVTVLGIALMGVANAAPLQNTKDYKMPQSQMQIQDSAGKSGDQGALQFEMSGKYMNKYTGAVENQDKNKNDSVTAKQYGQFNMGPQMDYKTMQQNHETMVQYMNGAGMMGGSRGSMGSGMGSGSMGM
ncbi:hypothetical protein [Desulfoscipio geothermicus]|uniref:Uncharacterized protein n=1 Tax=Desulfoscipio geothermicus DSM 3669 TaxID=1121426 RepID=A0A1I6DUV8_9FIRM|nr:hypothetical protein [Desulfoscipio geothermicus]SFR09269.1 hypothetical protein SAMN05660706_11841 [Desulfoscipio geothermicus DSM 3669]